MRIELERDGNMVRYSCFDDQDVEQKKVGWFDATKEIDEAHLTRIPLLSIIGRREGLSVDPATPMRPVPIVSVNPVAPVGDHQHEEFEQLHMHASDDYAQRVHDHPGVLASHEADHEREASHYQQERSRLQEAANLHQALGHPLPVHGHLEIQTRLQELDAAAVQALIHDHPHSHDGYLPVQDLMEFERKAEGQIAELAAQNLSLATRLEALQAAMVDSANKLAARLSALEAKPIDPHRHDYAVPADVEALRQDIAHLRLGLPARTQPTKSELLDSILAGHDLHIAGKVNNHERGAEVEYECACGFAISLPEGVLKL